MRVSFFLLPFCPSFLLPSSLPFPSLSSPFLLMEILQAVVERRIPSKNCIFQFYLEFRYSIIRLRVASSFGEIKIWSHRTWQYGCGKEIKPKCRLKQKQDHNKNVLTKLESQLGGQTPGDILPPPKLRINRNLLHS